MRIYLLFVCLISLNALGQKPHEHPEHPKGTSATMYLALPFYNEACELYANGKVEKAKKSLHEAINTSFELTEAQLFLADIYYEQGKIDSAFLYYYSGIDFNIEQKPHYYFKLFETGHLLGQYSMMKHNLGHFKKLYSNLGGEGPYEKEYSYKRDDFEFYEAVLTMVYDYKYWKPMAELFHKFDASTIFVSTSKNKPIIQTAKGVFQLKENFISKKKSKKIKNLPAGTEDLFITSDGNAALYTLTKENKTILYYSLKKGNKFGKPIAFSNEINSSNWQGTPFLTEDHQFLYYSSNISGNKDIYVAKVNLVTNKMEKPKALSRINTNKDEIAPYINSVNNAFYFSSNGMLGFGGQDLFYCNHYEVIDGSIFPFDAQNFGATYNSHLDEVSLRSYKNKFVLNRKVKQTISSLMFESIIIKEINFLITPTN
jgi:tetratricopeptide (TPR) repeat protein